MSRGAWRIASPQTGGAAVEFALVLPIFLVLLYGLVTFGALLYTQLALSRAAEDGARAASFIAAPPGGGSPSYAPVIAEVINSLSASIVAPRSSNTSYATRKAWLQTQVQPTVTVTPDVSCGNTAAAGVLRVQIVYPYSASAGTRIVPAISLPLVGSLAGWMPNELRACAAVPI